MSVPDRPRSLLAVLVVDDEPDSANSLAELLEFYGYDARVALNGEDALRCADADPPDVIFLDVLMPLMDGCAVARALRERAGAKRPLIVAVTGYDGAASRAHTTDAGFDMHLIKPVDTAVLVGILERLRLALAPPPPATELEPPPEEPPDRRGSDRAPLHQSDPSCPYSSLTRALAIRY